MIEERDLAQLLDRALQQRQSLPSTRPQLAELIHLARTLEASAATIAPTAQFRRAVRQRLLAHMAKSTAYGRDRCRPLHERIARWAARFAAGLGALALAGTAVATASASALPGDALYPVKQASEAVAVGIAPTDSARQEVLLAQADVRLDETARLLEQGRGSDALANVGRYDAAIDTVAADAPPAPALQTHLEANQSRLTQLLETAPAQARPGLQRALDATQRGLAHRENAQHTEASPTGVPEHRDPTPTRVEPTPPANSSEASPVVEPTVAPTQAVRGAEPPHEEPVAPRPATVGQGNDAHIQTSDSTPGKSHAVSQSEGDPNVPRNPTTNTRPQPSTRSERTAARARPLR